MKEFNVTGNCTSHMHYMVDITNKLIQIRKLVDGGKYFTINRARQYGKTTTRYALEDYLKEDYLVINISFEGIGDAIFKEEEVFAGELFNIFANSVRVTNKELEREFRKYGNGISSLSQLSMEITKFCENQSKKVVLVIDEVDKSSNNQLFLSFLGMLRDKYLARNANRDITFHSVILFGVYDVKNLKLKLRSDSERKYNSPWNIAADFKVDMSFNTKEISTMLVEYEKDYSTGMDIEAISHEIYKFTSGYPFLVSKICKLIDEELDKDWSLEGVENAVRMLLDEKNTLFDDLIKNLENNRELYDMIYDVVIMGRKIAFNVYNPLIDAGVMFGILEKSGTSIAVSNSIFELCIYNYMISKRATSKGELVTYEYRAQFIKNDKLDMEVALNKFQEIMQNRPLPHNYLCILILKII